MESWKAHQVRLQTPLLDFVEPPALSSQDMSRGTRLSSCVAGLTASSALPASLSCRLAAQNKAQSALQQSLWTLGPGLGTSIDDEGERRDVWLQALTDAVLSGF